MLGVEQALADLGHQAIGQRQILNRVQRSLAAVTAAATEARNVIPPIESAVVLGATLGECMNALRTVYGTYQEGGSF